MAESLPISHEIKLNDHHKVCHAPTLSYIIRNLYLFSSRTTYRPSLPSPLTPRALASSPVATTTTSSSGTLREWTDRSGHFAASNHAGGTKCVSWRFLFTALDTKKDGSLTSCVIIPSQLLSPCQIHDLHYSLTGDSFLIVPGSSRPKIYDRDGFEMCVLVSFLSSFFFQGKEKRGVSNGGSTRAKSLASLHVDRTLICLSLLMQPRVR